MQTGGNGGKNIENCDCNLNEGTQLVSDLINSEKTVSITEINDGNNETNPADQTAGVGSDSTIRFSPNSTEGGASMWTASTYGGTFYMGEMFITEVEVSSRQKKAALETSRYKVEGFNPFSWSDGEILGRFVNPSSFFNGFSN